MSKTDLVVIIPACLASGAHQMGEESSLVLFVAARALDRQGSGRVRLDDIRRACRDLFSSRQLARVLSDPASIRYWELEARFLRLRSQAAIVKSFPCEILLSEHARKFPLAILNSRPGRGAALLSAILAGIDRPRSNAFVSRFGGVDRKTVSRWMDDAVIKEHILQRVPAWTTE